MQRHDTGGGTGRRCLALVNAARPERTPHQRQCSRLWSALTTQRLIFPRFDEAVGLRHTVLLCPRGTRPESAVRACVETNQ